MEKNRVIYTDLDTGEQKAYCDFKPHIPEEIELLLRPRVLCQFYLDDFLELEVYKKCGQPHRIDGPAWICHKSNRELWFVDGVEMKSWVYFHAFAKDYVSEEELFLIKMRYW